jgi:O-antigen ligase
MPPPRSFAPRAQEGPTGESASAIFRILLATFTAGIAANDLLVWAIGGSASVAASALAGAPLAAVAALRVVGTGRLQAPSPALTCLTALGAWGLLGVLWAQDLEALGRSLTTLVQLVVMSWLLWQALRSPGDVRASFAGYVLGCVIVVAAACQQYRIGAVYLGADADGAWGPARYAAPGFDPNEMGVTIALGIPMAVYLALAGRRRARWLALAYVPVGALGIALSGSRGALLTAGVATGCGMVWMARHGAAPLIATLSTLVAALALTLSMVETETLGRLMTVTDELHGSLGDRREIWSAGWTALQDSPFLGAGLGNFARAVSPYLSDTAPHNTPLQLAVELGAPGFLLFYGGQLLVAARARSCPGDRRALVWILLLTVLLGSLTLGIVLRKTTWLVLFLGEALVTAAPLDDAPS